jgi:hypothetical protein
MTQADTTIKEGTFVRVPKGTKVYSCSNAAGKSNYVGYGALDRYDEAVSTREVVVKVTNLTEQWHWSESPSGGPATRVVLGTIVAWSAGDKFTFIENVTPTEAPVRKERTETVNKGPTLRQRMVKGTKWKLTKDAKLVKKGSSYHELLDDGIIPAGTVIEVIDKFQTYGPGYASGLWVPVKFPGWESRLVEFSQINRDPEQVGMAEAVPIYVIWDKALQQYYTGYEWGGYDRETFETKPSTIEYSEKLTRAKKFNRLADVRAHALVQSGYYYNLPGTWGSVPDWMETEKTFDIPDTWEIVKIDKLTKTEMGRIELVDTFKRSWRLRDLTVKYGSAVRQVYSDLEKKGKLADYSAMMYFNIKEDNDTYRYDYELSPDEKAGVQEVIDRFEKGDMKVHKSNGGFALAVKDDATAVMARLMYTGKLECGVINFNTMQEVVADGK